MRIIVGVIQKQLNIFLQLFQSRTKFYHSGGLNNDITRYPKQAGRSIFKTIWKDTNMKKVSTTV